MITDFAEKNKLPKFRIQQFNQFFYKEIGESFDELFTWPKDLKEKLKQEIEFSTIEKVKELVSKEGNTIKTLFKTQDGKLIETVLMRHNDGRNTVCVSCMMGCPVNCSFCATGKMGFKGKLSSREIIDQVLYFERYLKKFEVRVTNVVYMGMGEPMLNLEAILDSIEVLNNPEKIGIGSRKITVSTSGYTRQMRQLFESGFRGRLAISLHASNQKVREELMPVAKQHNLDELMQTIDEYTKLTNKRVSYEYIMIDGITDTDESIRELTKLFGHRLAHINLIPYNRIQGVDYKTSPKDIISKFAERLNKLGIPTTIRITMGADVDAACGQLANQGS
jgi:23S rRNA (adenine2503-C2)-methyltransferase